MLLGYIWVSGSDDGALRDQQRQALLSVGVAETQIYEDLGCPRRQRRPGLDACLHALKSGDTLVIWQLERLVQSRAHLIEILQDLGQREVGLHVLVGKGAVIGTAALSLEMVIEVIAAITELEEQIVSDATLEGLAAARARGQQLGAQRKMTAALMRQAMTAISNSDVSMSAIAAKLGVTRATLYNYLNGDGSPKPAGLKLLQAETPDSMLD